MSTSLVSSKATHHASIDAKALKYVQDLKELFPEFSTDDLVSILSEYDNDFDRVVNAIAEGHVERWVTRKKDKRAPNVPTHGFAHSKESNGVSDREKSPRTSRGGGRGSTRRGRGNFRTERGGRRAAPSVQSPGAFSSTEHEPSTTPIEWGPDNVSISDTGLHRNEPSKTLTSVPPAEPDAYRSDELDPAAASQLSKDVAPLQSVKEQSDFAPVPAAKSAPKSTAQKLSWAQIAKPQEKKGIPPTVPATAPAPVPVDAPLPPVPSKAPSSTSDTVSISESLPADDKSTTQTQASTQEWEEPTTAQAPSWDDEPQPQAALPSSADSWITPPADVAKIESEKVVAEESTPPSQVKLEPLSTASAFPAQLGFQKVEASVPPLKPGTPVGYTRSVNSRAGHRFKTDQPVVMPSTFGLIEKLGMQFGSVRLGSDDMDNMSEPPITDVQGPNVPEREAVAETPPVAPETNVAEPPPTTALTQPTSITAAQAAFQRTLPTHSQQQSSQPSVPTRTVLQPPKAVSIAASQTAAHPPSQSSSTTTSAPLGSFSIQQTNPSSVRPSTPSYQQQQQPSQPSQAVQPAQLQASAQTATQTQQTQQFPLFPSHLESTASQHTSSNTLQQPQQTSSLQHGSYFRQPEQYFHTPTPPVGQSQDYGSFAPLSQQLGHQAQASHVSGFGSEHFSYNDTARGFYDSYNQSNYSGRSGIGHEDVGKSLSGAQPSQASTGLSQSSSQLSQQSSQQPQSTTQSQPAAGPTQQGYHHTMPPYFFNPYHQPPVYPYSNYGLNQYANRYPSQQPAHMFQTPNPSSGTPSGAKIQSGAQPQNPYVQGAPYQYDEYSHHPNPEFGNKLYGAQTFISGTSPAGGQLRGGPSNSSAGDTYNKYGGPASKEGAGASLPGGRSNVQSFYGGNNNRLPPVTAAGGTQSQLGQTQNQAYPPPVMNDNNFYYARQGYWQ